MLRAPSARFLAARKPWPGALDPGLKAARLITVRVQVPAEGEQLAAETAWRPDARQPPPTPDSCCGRGCADCVWITYWERMNAYEAAERVRAGKGPADAPAYVVPRPAVGGAGRRHTADELYGQAARSTGSATGYMSARDAKLRKA
jgi:hypothetical protein